MVVPRRLYSHTQLWSARCVSSLAGSLKKQQVEVRDTIPHSEIFHQVKHYITRHTLPSRANVITIATQSVDHICFDFTGFLSAPVQRHSHHATSSVRMRELRIADRGSEMMEDRWQRSLQTVVYGLRKLVATHSLTPPPSRHLADVARCLRHKKKKSENWLAGCCSLLAWLVAFCWAPRTRLVWALIRQRSSTAAAATGTEIEV
ncbi:uncharacterized protein LOC27207572 isoform X2 [Drosophila simulans]|uniref:uncharacterized protein LOC27207572 isoform X2 n=1 Tax=Drosophila simulans TaxID=7240 RepID=UPI001D127C12|nr:uncharacterized protein LOC27207572 isoform X2 [Drosophila simulans]